MRRFLAVVLALLALPLVAAAPDLTIKPRVIVYPFVANGSTIDREASSRLATIIATQMSQTKLVVVVPAPPATDRKDYRQAARASGADYYVSGFISPLGSGVSVVEQVVGVDSGVIVFSNTAQLQTYNDAAGQGDQLAQVLGRYANRGVAPGPAAPPVAASPTPVPGEGQQANIGGLFKRKKRTPAAAASATPSGAPVAAVRNVTPPPAAPASPPARPVASPSSSPAARLPAAVAAAQPAQAAPAGVGVLVTGSAATEARDAAWERITAAFQASGDRVVRLPATAVAGRPGDDTLCRENQVRDVAVATLDESRDGLFGGHNAHLDFAVFDCLGKRVWSKSYDDAAGGSKSAEAAAARVADRAVNAFLHPPKRRRR